MPRRPPFPEGRSDLVVRGSQSSQQHRMRTTLRLSAARVRVPCFWRASASWPSSTSVAASSIENTIVTSTRWQPAGHDDKELLLRVTLDWFELDVGAAPVLSGGAGDSLDSDRKSARLTLRGPRPSLTAMAVSRRRRLVVRPRADGHRPLSRKQHLARIRGAAVAATVNPVVRAKAEATKAARHNESHEEERAMVRFMVDEASRKEKRLRVARLSVYAPCA